jgi:hypothetical protein
MRSLRARRYLKSVMIASASLVARVLSRNRFYTIHVPMRSLWVFDCCGSCESLGWGEGGRCDLVLSAALGEVSNIVIVLV